MRVIGTKTHGYLDYTVGLLLIVAPWLLGFYKGGAETWVPVILGVGTLVYSLWTDYPLGMAKVIPMKTHLILDLVNGILLAASPWLFGFADYIRAPHLVLGIVEIVVVLMTKQTSGEGRTGRRRTIPVH
ncbi:MAG TPA: SPW repeat protein [Chitinophaga sp.]|uniref:SPW repeat domain-containing protein n=1 Tax=Chitinophaga sp. TaxID=1869181 RepID=UPI002F92D316